MKKREICNAMIGRKVWCENYAVKAGLCRKHAEEKEEFERQQKEREEKSKKLTGEHWGQHIENGVSYCLDCKKFED